MSVFTFFTDWEGPWVTNDFAYEVASHFFSPTFFERLSQYDDYLAYVAKMPGYNAGDTLRLLAPFLVAAGVTSAKLKELSKPVYVPEADEAMGHLIKRGFEPVVISTAYIQFLEVSAAHIGAQTVHGTNFVPEKYPLPKEERKLLLKAASEIESLDEIKLDIEKGVLNEESRKSVEWLDEFFWKKLSKMQAGRILDEVTVIGGRRKREVVESYNPENPVAIGDSISDFEMLEYAKGKGLAVSFNGNEFAVRHSTLAVISETAFGNAAAVVAYAKEGIAGINRLIEGDFGVVEEIANRLKGTEFHWITPENMEEIAEKSKRMRRRIRGEAGKLG
ncbi:hypothetical protein [Archaeoglobus veneficus]|uniref:Uncharacterized protein n=1 Tax=Archaeoglobus veneficus (strain DSM 11195 / SNP6) TaxID=693661 RepID=F2KRB2_ARCVS|nr:hypothetical protein [Archaeoglobus veneficus]AEA47846.1 hypothetical protein Arcve_1851 [Archaeoglobus veneficus SNP6]